MATKLKKVELESVDFVGNGANQDAYFKLVKNRDGETTEKSMFELFKAFMRGESPYSEEELQKQYVAKAKQTIKDENQLYTSVLKESIDSIIFNDVLTSEEKGNMLKKSMKEFNETMNEAIGKWAALEKSITDETIEKATSQKAGEKMVIDRSKLSAAELKKFDELIAKAATEGAEDDEMIETSKEDVSEAEKGCGSGKCNTDKACGSEDTEKAKCKKSMNEVLQEEVDALKKNMEAMAEKTEKDNLRELAKKYAPLGKDEEELVETMYTMKKSNEDIYNEFISVMDQNLDLVNKGGLFSEIGKSGNTGRYVGNDPQSKIEAAAAEIRKSHPEMSQYAAIEKAWEEHPELSAEYEKQYNERR